MTDGQKSRMICGRCFITGDENELKPLEWKRLRLGVELTFSIILSR
jgi:hypothetical protein